MEQVEAVYATDRALLCEFPDGEERWVPLSQLHEDSEVADIGDTGTLIVTRWWAERAQVEHLSTEAD